MRYTYRYVATSVTGVAGISKETTGHRIEAKCYIEGLGDCKSVLKVCFDNEKRIGRCYRQTASVNDLPFVGNTLLCLKESLKKRKVARDH